MNTLAFLNQGQLAATFIIIFVLFLIGAARRVARLGRLTHLPR